MGIQPIYLCGLSLSYQWATSLQKWAVPPWYSSLSTWRLKRRLVHRRWHSSHKFLKRVECLGNLCLLCQGMPDKSNQYQSPIRYIIPAFLIHCSYLVLQSRELNNSAEWKGQIRPTTEQQAHLLRPFLNQGSKGKLNWPKEEFGEISRGPADLQDI